MTDFALYDVTAICRVCGAEYPTKSFVQRTEDNPRYGLCPTHLEEDERYMAALKAPHPRATTKPTERRTDDDRRVLDFRRRAAGDI